MPTGESHRISFFIPAPSYGGAEKVTINLANGLAKRGRDVDLVLAYTEGPFSDEISQDVRIVDLNVPAVPLLGLFAGVPHLRSYLKTTNPAVLFAGLTHVNDVAILAKLFSGSSTHVTVTEHLAFGADTGFKKRFTSGLATFLYPHADDVVAVSGGVASSVAERTRVDSEDVTVLYNPIQIDDIQRKARESVDHDWLNSTDVRPIVSVGRLEPQKNVAGLLHAFVQVNDVRPDTRLIIVGKGSQRTRLVELSKSLGLDEVVDFPGYVDNPYGFMEAASLFVMSSDYEGLPTVLIEALACGCSVVSTDCPYGPREILEDGAYGRLVPVGDPGALAEGILQTLDDPTPAERSRKRAEDFSMANSLDRYEAYIQRVIDAHPGRSPGS